MTVSQKLHYRPEVLAQIEALWGQPLLDLVFRAATIHRQEQDPRAIQLCTLSSIKTGACPEDCSYCPQSARYKTGLKVEPLLSTEQVLEEAREAKAKGSTRFCMGAAWRDAPEGEDFERVLSMVRGVSAMGLEACCTLGMLTASQAERLAEAGLHSYNHNLDTSPEYYPEVIGTRTYEDRLETLARVEAAGINVCCGGIVGMGESVSDRQKFLAVLASLDPTPLSVPLNVLVPVVGTPLGESAPVEGLDFLRLVCIARVLMPKAMIRLSAGRKFLSEELQAFCFLAGANSIHTGEKLLTTANVGQDKDQLLLQKLGMYPQKVHLAS